MKKQYTILLKVLIAYHLEELELGVSIILAKGDAIYDIDLIPSSGVSSGKIVAQHNKQLYYLSPDRFVKCEGSMLRPLWANWKNKGEQRFNQHLSNS